MQLSQRRDGGSISDTAESVIHGLFEAQAATRPDQVAVRCGEEELSYGGLNAWANRLARHLQQLGVGPESLVALYLDRNSRMVAAILAVLKAGGAYVPIDLAYPTERIRFILDDAKPQVVITEEKLKGALPQTAASVLCLDSESRPIAAHSAQDLPCTVQGSNAAYVIYTSGSTGHPKGVVVTHHNVARLFSATAGFYGFSADDVWTLFHSFAFDFSVWELWGALIYGGKVVIVPYLVSRSPEAFHQMLVRERVTVLNQTPSAFRQLTWADQSAPNSQDLSLRWVIFGGEALELQTLRPWFERHPDRHPQLVNMYGITETTVHVTFRTIRRADVDAGRGSVIGEPIPDLTLHLLDDRQRPCPEGVAGEIYVGGAGVARGYLNRPELTATKFIPNSFTDTPGERLYRSGDLARRLPDGEIEYLGRIDEQVKIRGFRIELGEIESALAAHASVKACVVTAHTAESGEKQLAAYVVSSPLRPTIDALRSFLQEKLPAYMVPAHFVFLESLPLSINGKVARRALPAPDRLRPEMGTAFVPASTPSEKALAEIWQSVLQIDQVGLHDNFFALGGDSIRSIQVLARAQEHGLRLSLEQLFAEPTIAGLARSGRDVQEEHVPSVTRFGCISERDRMRLPPGLEDAYPMAKLQLGMVYHCARNPASAIFHDVFSFSFRLPFDEERLKLAVARLAQRHAIFRTSFDLGTYGEPLQLVHAAVEVPFTVEDLRAKTAEEQRSALVEWVETEKRKPFDWGCAPFLRLHAQRLGNESFQFIISFHHVIMDGWSLAAMLTELFQDYSRLLAGRDEAIAAPVVTYRDFVLLEQQASRADATRAFWLAQVDQPTINTLPRWPAEMRRGGTEQVRGPEYAIQSEVLAGLKRLAKVEGVPLRTVLLAAHCRVMSFVTGQSDVITGLVVNGRPQTIGGERMIGLFLNTLPFRLAVNGGTWHQLVQQVFQAERALLPHRRCPLPDIQQLAGGRALFETVFDFVQFHVYRDLPGYRERTFLEDHYFEANNFTFYLTCMLDASGSELQMHCDYDPNELCEPQIRLLCEYHLNTLRAMARSAGSHYEDHSPLPDSERERLLVEWNQTRRPFPQDLAVHQLIEAQAARTPEAVAALCGDEVLSYRELDQRATTLARRLRALGLGPKGLVGIHQRRSLNMLISLLAVLKAGGTYVPLDPSYPAARLDFMTQDAGIELVLTSQGITALAHSARRRLLVVEKLISECESGDGPEPSGSATPDDVAYVLYTSGSTGIPKGVQVSHKALVNFLHSMQRVPGFTSTDTLLAVTTLSFDIAALELFLPLVSGGRVIIASSETALDPEALAANLDRHHITVMQATPTTWRLLVQSGWTGRKGLTALCGGEAMPRELADALLERCGQVWNMYGPTESTVWSAVERVEQGTGPVPIGRPIDNTEFYVLDAERRLVPTGCDGELYIGGAGLAEGYLGRPEQTAERFVSHPFTTNAAARLYRTGDLGRYLPNGKLICAGRLDHQVKIRGFRIELGEIESTLAAHPAVAAAVVCAREDQAGGKRLVAYYVLQPSMIAEPQELREFLDVRLPIYMVPAGFVQLPDLPLTPNGKVDRQRLPEPAAATPETLAQFVAPRTPLEERLVALWQEVLKVQGVGIADNFFELGGHSLSAIQVVGRLRRDLGVNVNVAVLFENPCIESFALEVLTRLLEGEEANAGPDGGLEIKSSAERRNKSLSVS